MKKPTKILFLMTSICFFSTEQAFWKKIKSFFPTPQAPKNTQKIYNNNLICNQPKEDRKTPGNTFWHRFCNFFYYQPKPMQYEKAIHQQHLSEKQRLKQQENKKQREQEKLYFDTMMHNNTRTIMYNNNVDKSKQIPNTRQASANNNFEMALLPNSIKNKAKEIKQENQRKNKTHLEKTGGSSTLVRPINQEIQQANSYSATIKLKTVDYDAQTRRSEV